MEKTHTHIEQKILKAKKGELIFPTDFRGTGTVEAINKTLSRLAKKGIIKRLAHGIYYVPKIDSVLGELRPSADDVVRMIAEKEKIKIKPAGAYALHELGLTNQVPMRRVYLTDGNDKKFTLGKLQIKFKSTTPKKLGLKGKISGLVIQALEELDQKNIDPITEMKIRDLLIKESRNLLKHDLKISSMTINNYIVKLLKEINL